MSKIGLVLFFGFLLIFSSSALFAESPRLGSNGILPDSCSGSDGKYAWYTVSRTRWSVSDILAVPTGITDPANWSDAAAFRARVHELVPANPTIQDYADACSSVWTEFFSSPADVVTRFKRSVLTSKRDVMCASGVWTASSESIENNTDDLGWTLVSETSFDVTNPDSAGRLRSNLDTLSTLLNAQPGASTESFDSLVRVEE